MLASPANQLTNGETTAVTPARTANILTLEFSGVQHEPVLLAPGKWSIGSSTAIPGRSASSRSLGLRAE
jgi:hypothetical protein